MIMSERNQLLIDLQNDIGKQLHYHIDSAQECHDIEFTNDEIKGAIQHVLLTYGKIES